MAAQRPPLFTASRVQTATYLLVVCPFSIAFLVFLNSSVSFVVTYLIGLEEGEGDAVGSLGFADELLALVACPAWGLLSDRIGVRYVSQEEAFHLSQKPDEETDLCYRSGMHSRLYDYCSSLGRIRPIVQCLSATSSRTTTIQSRRLSCFDHGDSDTTYGNGRRYLSA